MKSKKDQASKIIAFILILLGFIASIGIGATGTIMSIKQFIDDQKPVEIFVHPFYDEGKLWFYNSTKEVISTYNCQGGAYCGYAYEFLDDEAYSLQYYNDGTINKIESIGGIYAFIIDAEKTDAEITDTYYRSTPIKLYEIRSGNVLNEYSAIKNYSMLPDRTFIIRAQDGKWGIVQFVGPDMNQIADFEYDYIGVFAANEKLAPTDFQYYVALKNGQWLLLDNTGKPATTPINDAIYANEGKVMIAKTSKNGYRLYNENGQLVDELTFDGVYITEKGYVIAYKIGLRAIITDNTGKVLKDFGLMYGDWPSYKYDDATDEVVVTNMGQEIFREKSVYAEEDTPAPQPTN